MSNIKPKRIVLHGCYSASNRDLKIKDRDGNYMKGCHDVFVMCKPNKKGFVKVKTITSLENANSKTFHNSALLDVKNGIIIPIPDKLINATRLSGVNMESITIHVSKLHNSKRNFKYPAIYNDILSKNHK